MQKHEHPMSYRESCFQYIGPMHSLGTPYKIEQETPCGQTQPLTVLQVHYFDVNYFVKWCLEGANDATSKQVGANFKEKTLKLHPKLTVIAWLKRLAKMASVEIVVENQNLIYLRLS